MKNGGIVRTSNMSNIEIQNKEFIEAINGLNREYRYIVYGSDNERKLNVKKFYKRMADKMCAKFYNMEVDKLMSKYGLSYDDEEDEPNVPGVIRCVVGGKKEFYDECDEKAYVMSNIAGSVNEDWRWFRERVNECCECVVYPRELIDDECIECGLEFWNSTIEV